MSQSESGNKVVFMLLAVNVTGSICILCDYCGIKQILARNISRYTLAIFMILAGLAHFDAALMSFYMNIMPPVIPYKRELIYLSGIFEILSGLLSLFKSTQTIGGYLTIATLLGVFPANIYLAISQKSQLNMRITQSQAFARLPLQVIMILMAYIYTNRTKPVKQD